MFLSRIDDRGAVMCYEIDDVELRIIKWGGSYAYGGSKSYSPQRRQERAWSFSTAIHGAGVCAIGETRARATLLARELYEQIVEQARQVTVAAQRQMPRPFIHAPTLLGGVSGI